MEAGSRGARVRGCELSRRRGRREAGRAPRESVPGRLCGSQPQTGCGRVRPPGTTPKERLSQACTPGAQGRPTEGLQNRVPQGAPWDTAAPPAAPEPGPWALTAPLRWVLVPARRKGRGWSSARPSHFLEAAQLPSCWPAPTHTRLTSEDGTGFGGRPARPHRATGGLRNVFRASSAFLTLSLLPSVSSLRRNVYPLAPHAAAGPATDEPRRLREGLAGQPG